MRWKSEINGPRGDKGTKGQKGQTGTGNTGAAGAKGQKGTTGASGGGGGSAPAFTSDPSLGLTDSLGGPITATGPAAGPVILNHPPMVGAGTPQGYLAFVATNGTTYYVPAWAP